MSTFRKKLSTSVNKKSKKSNKPQLFSVKNLILVTIIFIALAIIIKISNLNLKAPEIYEITEESNYTETTPAKVKVDFPFTVKAVSAERIILTGENGDYYISNDPSKVSVYKGKDNSSPKMAISDLAVNQELNLEFIPGRSFELFLGLE